MSRREFRAVVVAPRSSAAWLMSLVASGSLWITSLIPVWMMGIQCLAFAVSFGTRKNPPALLKSAIWLNVLMAGITTVTVRSALAGNPATLSLAYFTALSQGLQLLDARPRKSEFVLVALSLFQIILASNLTDSVFFPPLVLLFLVTVTWTLLVHTISMEAAEAGDPTAATTALVPDLRRLTFVATSACLVLAVAIFVLFPRLKTDMLRGGMGSGLAISGFSDRVRLGEIGRIRMDHSLVLRVEGLEGTLPKPDEAYWRGLAFDEFDGRNWSISESERIISRRRISGIGRFGINLRPREFSDTIVQRIIREPVKASVVFVSGDVQRIEGSFQHLERDPNGGFYLPGYGEERIRYTIWSEGHLLNRDRLRADRAAAPLESWPGGKRPTRRYFQLPELDPRVAERAEQIMSGATNDFDRALRLQEDLRRRGRYTDSPPALGDGQTSPIEAFVLGELEGHCEYFASAMVTMARTQGLPSRLVNGFAGGVRNEVGGFIEVTQADAHAWVEIHFEKAGWVRFDPTPPDRRLRAGEDLSVWDSLAQFGDALELWWFQRVVDFDSVDQIGVIRGLWLRWTADRGEGLPSQASSPSTEPEGWTNPFADSGPVSWFAAFVLILIALALWRRNRVPSSAPIPKAYRDALRILARKGLAREASVSARDFAKQVGEKIPTLGSDAFHIITEGYLAERFGRNESSSNASSPSVGEPNEIRPQATPRLEQEVLILKDAVNRMRLGNQAHIRELLLSSPKPLE